MWPELSGYQANDPETDNTGHKRSAGEGKIERKCGFWSPLHNGSVELQPGTRQPSVDSHRVIYMVELNPIFFSRRCKHEPVD